MIYLTFAIVSAIGLALFCNTVFVNGSHHVNSYVGETITVCLMSLLTASRAISVGTDTINYYYSAQSITRNYDSIKDIFHGYYIEPGYGLLEYFSMKYIGDIHFLFLIEGIVLMCGLFSFLHNFKGKTSYSLAFICFFCFYYNTSLNISRQYIAVGIGFFAVKYLFTENWKNYFILCCISLLFHSTSVLFFISFFIWKYLNSDRSNKHYKKKLGVLILLISIGIGMFVPISSMLIRIGVLPEKYTDFLNANDASSSLVMVVLANLPLMFLLWILNKKLIEYDTRNEMAITMYLLGFAVSLINCIIGNVGRLAIYWTSWQVILYPECCELLVTNVKNKSSRFIIQGCYILFMILYWYYCVIVRNFGGTYPYHSDLFNWLNWE